MFGVFHENKNFKIYLIFDNLFYKNGMLMFFVVADNAVLI